MPEVRTADKKVIAVVASDLHLRARCPISRAEKENWLDVQARYLRLLQDELDANRGSVLIVPGDVFDRWNSTPELINFAIEHLPYCYAVPGQHDLPFHRYEDKNKSAYWTLVHAGKIHDLAHGVPVEVNDRLTLYGFPWNHEVTPPVKGNDIKVAVVHAYVWKKGKTFPGAPETSYYKNWWGTIKGYDIMVAGDNHSGFLVHNEKTNQHLLNCGAFYRAKSDEKDYKPAVGLIHADGTVTRKYMDHSSDRWEDVAIPKDVEESGLDVEGFLEVLAELGDSVLDFSEAVRQYLNKHRVGGAVRKLLLKFLEGE